MQPEVRPLPAQVLFGSRPVGDKAEDFVVLQAPAGIDPVLERAEADSPDVHVEPIVVSGSPPGRTFRITQYVSKEGYQKSCVRFALRTAGRHPVEVAVDVSYTGFARRQPPPAAGEEKLP